jgi:mannitol-1-phosphate 5-dehydrogenase
MTLYPGEFTYTQLEAHIDDLLHRFRNKALGDTIFRVGCDLYRKLSPEDRIVAPIKAAINLNKPYEMILNALSAAISFRAKDELGKYFLSDEKFFSEADKGTNHILKDICRLNIPV